MTDLFIDGLKRNTSIKTPERLLTYAFATRVVLLIYGIVHDLFVNHIKYTDIDYHVFTNGSKALLEGSSPYKDVEYRYPPLVGLFFLPNLMLNENIGKVLLISTDLVAARLLYMLNVYQGTNRNNSKFYLTLWLFNPITLAISTRGSFEPILISFILLCIYFLASENYVFSGLLYGLSIHIKLYPIIYALSLYFYIVQRKPYFKTQTKLWYWIRTLSPNVNHYKFFITALSSLIICSYISFRYYGNEYLEQSIVYHFKRIDLQHNFSIYFYLFKLFPEHQRIISDVAFIVQSSAVLLISLLYCGFDPNKRIRLRKLTFSLFASTFVFVSLNKVCTSQYFTWYLAFVPLILDSVKLSFKQARAITIVWLLSQANWLLFAYLYEYQGMNVLDLVGGSSILLLITNICILFTLCGKFDASAKRQDKDMKST